LPSFRYKNRHIFVFKKQLKSLLYKFIIMAEVPTFKLVLVGDGGTGTKRATTTRFAFSLFCFFTSHVCLRVFYIHIYVPVLCANLEPIIIIVMSSSGCFFFFRSETKRRVLEMIDNAWYNCSALFLSFRDFEILTTNRIRRKQKDDD